MWDSQMNGRLLKNGWIPRVVFNNKVCLQRHRRKNRKTTRKQLVMLIWEHVDNTSWCGACSSVCVVFRSCSHLCSPFLELHFCTGAWNSSLFTLKVMVFSSRKVRRMFLEENKKQLVSWKECLPKEKSERTTPTQFKQYLGRHLAAVCKDFKVADMNGG